MDGDGLPDLAALSTMKKAIVIYRNQGAGVFGGAETTLELDLSRLGTAALGQMRGADLNRDGLLDLLVTIGFSHVTLLNPRGGKWPIEDAVLEPGRNPSAIDVNTDGWPDLFVPPLTGGMALSGIYPAIGYGYFSQNPAAAPNLQRYLFGDIDGDGKADMVGLLGGDLLFSLNQSQ